MREQPRWGPAPNRQNASGRPPMGTRRENPRARAAREAQGVQVPQDTRTPRAGGRVYERSPQTAAPEPERPRSEGTERRFERSQSSPAESLQAQQEKQRQEEVRAQKEQLLQNQIQQIDGSLFKTQQEQKRLKLDGLQWEADSKEGLVLALKRSRELLTKQLTDLQT